MTDGNAEWEHNEADTGGDNAYTAAAVAVAAACNAAASSYDAALPSAVGTALVSTAAAAVCAVDLVPATANQNRCFAS